MRCRRASSTPQQKARLLKNSKPQKLLIKDLCALLLSHLISLSYFISCQVRLFIWKHQSSEMSDQVQNLIKLTFYLLQGFSSTSLFLVSPVFYTMYALLFQLLMSSIPQRRNGNHLIWTSFVTEERRCCFRRSEILHSFEQFMPSSPYVLSI